MRSAGLRALFPAWAAGARAHVGGLSSATSSLVRAFFYFLEALPGFPYTSFTYHSLPLNTVLPCNVWGKRDSSVLLCLLSWPLLLACDTPTCAVFCFAFEN